MKFTSRIFSISAPPVEAAPPAVSPWMWRGEAGGCRGRDLRSVDDSECFFNSSQGVCGGSGSHTPMSLSQRQQEELRGLKLLVVPGEMGGPSIHQPAAQSCVWACSEAPPGQAGGREGEEPPPNLPLSLLSSSFLLLSGSATADQLFPPLYPGVLKRWWTVLTPGEKKPLRNSAEPRDEESQ